jgi:hypothetical protein
LIGKSRDRVERVRQFVLTHDRVHKLPLGNEQLLSLASIERPLWVTSRQFSPICANGSFGAVSGRLKCLAIVKTRGS